MSKYFEGHIKCLNTKKNYGILKSDSGENLKFYLKYLNLNNLRIR